MTLQQLRYVTAVAETGTISGAAKALFISQPSLTAAIQELEKEMGVTIFLRTNRGVVLSREMPDDLILRLRPDARTAVVALTHDPKLDDLALIDALQSDAFYVGAIGSRRHTGLRRDRLREHFGLADAELDALHGPAGLYIGSKTPAEIALSIMAEVVAVKNGIEQPTPQPVADGKAAQGGDQRQGLPASCAV